MKKALLVALLWLAVLPALSCTGRGGTVSPVPSLPVPSPAPSPWPIQRHPSMAQWDAAPAAWKEAWRTAPTAPPLSSFPLSIDEALALAEEISGRIPPTPLPRPFQTPSRVEMSPFYEDPARPFFEQGGQGIRPVFLADNNAIAHTVYWLQPGETFGGLLFFGYYVYPPPPEAAQGEDLRLFCLLDYRQTPFRFDGVDGVVHDFHMGPNEERAFHLEFPDLPQGFHSLNCLYYINPDASPVSWDSRSYGFWSHLVSANGEGPSAFLLVGEERQSGVRYTPLPGSLPATPDLHDALMLNRSAAEEDAWHDWMPEVWENGQLVRWGPVEAAPGEQVEAVLRANNCDAEPFRFGVAAFLDYRQVPLRVGDSEPVAWYELLPGRQEVIPISFIAPREPGPHVYFIVQFQAPYEPMTAYEWADDVVRFPWVALEDGGVTRPFLIPNMRYEPPVSAFFDRIPLLVK